MKELMLSSLPNEVKMDSREIAELTGKQHKHIMRDIRVQLTAQNIGQSKFGHSYLNTQNKEQPCFLLDYKQTMILITGYSISLRAKVIDRWMELESNTAPKIPQTYPEALRALADKHEENNRLKSELVENEPKVKVHNQIMDSEGLTLPTDAGRGIMGRPNIFTRWLREIKVLYKESAHKPLRPMARFIEKGYLVVKMVYNEKQDKSFTQTYFTPKGVIWITKKWNKLMEESDEQ